MSVLEKTQNHWIKYNFQVHVVPSCIKHVLIIFFGYLCLVMDFDSNMAKKQKRSSEGASLPLPSLCLSQGISQY